MPGAALGPKLPLRVRCLARRQMRPHTDRRRPIVSNALHIGGRRATAATTTRHGRPSSAPDPTRARRPATPRPPFT